MSTKRPEILLDKFGTYDIVWPLILEITVSRIFIERSFHKRFAERRMLKMKGTSALAIAVCIACFLIGYLTYLGLMLFVDFFIERIDPCLNSVQVCSQQQLGSRPN